jgi:hypothetical protein
LMGWRNTRDGFIPAKDWNLSTLTETPLMHTDYHQGPPTSHYIVIGIRWHGFNRYLWFIFSYVESFKIWMEKCQQPVFHVVGWRDEGHILKANPKAPFAAIKDTSLEHEGKMAGSLGKKYLLIHYRIHDLRRTFMFSLGAARFYVDSLFHWCFHKLTVKRR